MKTHGSVSCPVGIGIYDQAWWPKFKPKDLPAGMNELNLTSCLLTSSTYTLCVLVNFSANLIQPGKMELCNLRIASMRLASGHAMSLRDGCSRSTIAMWEPSLLCQHHLWTSLGYIEKQVEHEAGNQPISSRPHGSCLSSCSSLP